MWTAEQREYGRRWKQTFTGLWYICLQCSGRYQGKKGDRPGRRFCDKVCANRFKSWVTRAQRGNTLRGRGAGKAYPKIGGRHAHRVIAEQKLGRALRPGEIVHHLNGDILDYRPENLEVLSSQGIHINKHRADLIAGRK